MKKMTYAISVEKVDLVAFNVSLHTINGMSVGIEFPPKESIDEEHPEDIGFVMCIDLLIFRIVIFTFRETKEE